MTLVFNITSAMPTQNCNMHSIFAFEVRNILYNYDYSRKILAPYVMYIIH